MGGHEAGIEGGGADAESAFAAWALRVEEGEELEFDALVGAHPLLEAELRRLHEDWKLFAPILGKAVPGLVADESGVVAPLSGGPEGEDTPPADALYARLGIDGSNEGRYRFRSVIGRGGGGVVLKVWDAKLNRPLAMKVVLGRVEDGPSGQTPKVDSRTLSRFVDEARIASQLNHPGIVPVHELGKDETGRAFFTMKLVKGLDLAHIFAMVQSGEDAWNPTRALTVLLRVCEAMAYAHDKGVIHRDLKPANIMVGAYGEVYVMDWGLARVIGLPDPRDLRIRPASGGPVSVVNSIRKGDREAEPDSSLVTMDGSVLGTPSYMAPEQARGEIEEVGTRSDVYSIGAILYHLIGGEPPYMPRGQKLPAGVVLTNLLHGPPRHLESLAPRVSPELAAICEKAMARNANARYETMRSLAGDLRAFLEKRVVAAYETGAWAETRKWVQRNRVLAVTAGVLIAATAGLGALGLDRQRLENANHALAGARQTEREASEKLVSSNEELRSALAREEAAGLRSRWNSTLAVASLLNPAEADTKAMIVRELPESMDPSIGNRAIRVASGEYHRAGTLSGHTGRVNAVAWSPDETRVVTASNDDTARIYRADGTGDPIVLSGHAGSVVLADWSPDGTRIVTASPDGTARVWNSDGTGEALVLRMSQSSVAVQGDTSQAWAAAQASRREFEVDAAAWSSDGTRIVTASRDGIARVWSGAGAGDPIAIGEGGWFTVQPLDNSGTPVRFRTSSVVVQVAALSPDGTRIVTASNGGVVHVWNANGNGEPRNFPGHAASVNSAAWSPDGKRIATASEDGTLRVWNADGGAEPLVLRGHGGGVNSAAWSSDGTRIVTASQDGTARVWEVDGPGVTVLRGHSGSVTSAQWNRDGSRILTVSLDATARVWNADGHGDALVLRGMSAVTSASWSPSGAFIATGMESGAVQLWQIEGGAQPFALEQDESVLAVDWAIDGVRLVTASPNYIVQIRYADGRWVGLTLPGNKQVRSAALSPDGERLATILGKDLVLILDVRGTNGPYFLKGHDDQVNAVTWSPDGMKVVTASDDGTALTLSPETGPREMGLSQGEPWRVRCPSDATPKSRSLRS